MLAIPVGYLKSNMDRFIDKAVLSLTPANKI